MSGIKNLSVYTTARRYAAITIHAQPSIDSARFRPKRHARIRSGNLGCRGNEPVPSRIHPW
jgi:hypothetical protein